MAWVKRSYKRDWLQRSPCLNTVAYRHELSNITAWDVKPESMDKDPNKLTWGEDYNPVERLMAQFELIFNIGSEIIKFHANENIGPADALRDYVRKLEQLREVLNRFLTEYKPHFDMGKVFVLKEFLNNSTGPSAVYTSMVGIGTSTTHGFFLDLSDCTNKNRLYETKERNFVELIVKLTKFLTGAITDATAALDTYKGRL